MALASVITLVACLAVAWWLSWRRADIHIVMLSGGRSSFECLRRAIARYGRSRVQAWFLDTKVEDVDTYRFLDDTERVLRIRIQRFAEGRTPWEVFRDERFIGNSRADPCSKILKRGYAKKLLTARYPDDPRVVLHLGLDWQEEHRIKSVRRNWGSQGYRTAFLLLEEPYLFDDDYLAVIRSYGIEPPAAYAMGFPHNNCMAIGCVKGGISYWEHIRDTLPDVFWASAAKEQDMRVYLDADVAILRSRKGGESRPLTLLELGSQPQQLEFPDWGACSCFAEVA